VTILALGLFLTGVPLQVDSLSRGFLGVMIDPLEEGWRIVSTSPGQPAEKAGILPGDLLLAIDDRPLSHTPPAGQSLPNLRGSPGNKVTLTVQSSGGTIRKVPLIYAGPDQLPLGLSQSAFAWFAAAWDIFFILGYILVAALLILRSREDRFAILVAFSLILIAVRIPPEYYLFDTQSGLWVWPIRLLATLGYTAIPLVLTLFPDGRWYPRWIWVYPLVGALYASLVNLVNWYPTSDLYGSRQLIDALIIGLGVIVQIYRYRTVSTPRQRLQTKWVMFGIAVGFLGYYGFNLIYTLNVLPAIFPGLTANTSSIFLYNLAGRLYYLALFSIPITLAISILRYRLWDIDVIIRRTLIYSLLTLTLAGMYIGMVIVFQDAFLMVTGQQSSLAIVASTLAITILFTPLRRGLQNFIDRRFYRLKYDAAQTLESFASAARSQVDLDRLTGELLQVVEHTMQPRNTSLWLRPLRRTEGHQSPEIDPKAQTLVTK